MYADDRIVIRTDDTWLLAQNRMNKYLEKVNKWLIANQLSLNTSVFITCSSCADIVTIELNIIINGQKTKRVGFCKYLGIYLDSRLKWNKHVMETVKRTKYFIFCFSNLSKFMNVDTTANCVLRFLP